MSSDKYFGFNFDSTQKSVDEESLQRIEEQCDRSTESYLWGAYKVEEVDCPEPQSSHEESDTDDDDDSFQDDFDDY
ncbi:MAG: hypothetical protein KME28_15870 [Pelatocladus maniniholoensis HA4357-MV3]|jgi:hypothetical protein|uniref:Uncharacterized protein n=1 Tax=Pelatocladus maniniholoensis HA4357-MV3 TaxID=1117104 RepID=A0A9E3H9G2_9NOST|nr:hypothetical protein [Pelatocladus maniniholoensis HA4357-MV3]